MGFKAIEKEKAGNQKAVKKVWSLDDINSFFVCIQWPQQRKSNSSNYKKIHVDRGHNSWWNVDKVATNDCPGI